jgi:hypothetical protein
MSETAKAITTEGANEDDRTPATVPGTAGGTEKRRAEQGRGVRIGDLFRAVRKASGGRRARRAATRKTRGE